jgi:hypothetical protein
MTGVNLTNPTLTYILAGLSIAALIAVIAWAHAQRRLLQSLRLKQRFGQEYGRTVEELGSQEKAETELAARERRVERLRIVPLTSAEVARFAQAWNAPQGRFLDDPKGAVADADRLVYDLMSKRGYPMGDFERRAADISVDHPDVVVNYRAAHSIALRSEHGEASTEELRRALVHFRALFQDLLEVRGEVRGPSGPLAPKHVPAA